MQYDVWINGESWGPGIIQDGDRWWYLMKRGMFTLGSHRSTEQEAVDALAEADLSAQFERMRKDPSAYFLSPLEHASIQDPVTMCSCGKHTASPRDVVSHTRDAGIWMHFNCGVYTDGMYIAPGEMFHPALGGERLCQGCAANKRGSR